MKKRNCLVFYFLSLLLSGCGLPKMLEKTGKNTEEMLQNVEAGNELQQQILAANNEIVKGIHKQTLAVSLENMFKPENTAQLRPPTRMMPFAHTFANEATANEIIETQHVLISDAYYGDILNFKSRLTSLVGAGAIAGFTSMDKTRHIFRNHVENPGEYEETAYRFAMVRYLFIRDALFLPIVEKVKYLNVQNLRKLVDYFFSLKHLANLPYQGRFEIDIPDLFVNETLNPTEIGTLASRAKQRFQNKLKPSELARQEVKDLLNQLGP